MRSASAALDLPTRKFDIDLRFTESLAQLLKQLKEPNEEARH